MSRWLWLKKATASCGLFVSPVRPCSSDLLPSLLDAQYTKLQQCVAHEEKAEQIVSELSDEAGDGAEACGSKERQ